LMQCSCDAQRLKTLSYLTTAIASPALSGQYPGAAGCAYNLRVTLPTF
jgi:hypothetical protein